MLKREKMNSANLRLLAVVMCRMLLHQKLYVTDSHCNICVIIQNLTIASFTHTLTYIGLATTVCLVWNIYVCA